METVTRRRKPHHSGESAAIALTARMLSGLKTGAADAIHLIPSACVPAYHPEWVGLPNSAVTDDGSLCFQRRHDGNHGTTWFGFEKLLDQHGRRWERHFHAVIDDFGNLVEVER